MDEQKLLTDVFAPARSLEPTDADVAAVLRRLDAPAVGRHRRLPGFGAFRGGRFALPVIGVATAVAIAIVAIALGGGPQRSQLGVPAGTPPATRALVAKLAVLRRPQTPSDRLPAGLTLPRLVRLRGAIIPDLTRFVGTVPGGRLYLVVIHQRPSRGNPVAYLQLPGDWAGLMVVAGGREFLSGAVTAPTLYDPRFVLHFDVHGRQYLAEIVPDVVARVSWPQIGSVGHSNLVPAVADNVALLAVSRGAAVGGARWYDAAGRPVRTSERALNAAIASLAAKTAPRLRRLEAQRLRRAEANTTQAPVAVLRSFPIFSSGALGSHRSGIQILHPPLPSLSASVLSTLMDSGPGRPAIHQVREVRSGSGADFYVVPSTRGACIFSFSAPRRTSGSGPFGLTSSGGGSCQASVSQTLANGLVDGEHLPDGTAITVGVMPAWVREVILVHPGGANRSVPLTDGVFVIRNAGVREILLPGLRPNAMIRLP